MRGKRIAKILMGSVCGVTLGVVMMMASRTEARTAFVCEGRIGNAAINPAYPLAGDFEFDIGTNTAAPYATGQFGWLSSNAVPFVVIYDANTRLARFQLGGGELMFPLNPGDFLNEDGAVANLNFRLRAVPAGSNVTLTNLILQVSTQPGATLEAAFGPAYGNSQILTNIPSVNLQGGFRLDGEAIFAWTSTPPARSQLAFQISAEEPVITSVEWAEYVEGGVVKGGPLVVDGGGKKIFPEAVDPTDAHGSTRQFVTVRAVLDIPIKGVPVNFKVLDVDDPSSDAEVMDTNDKRSGFPLFPDYQEDTGDDNRDDGTGVDSTGQFSSGEKVVTVVTDSQGIAEAVMSVSRQPGNNYRVAASTIDQTMDNLTVIKDDEGKIYIPPDNVDLVPGFFGRLSPLLTVWRTVHLEIDSMEPVVGNSISGLITSIQRDPGNGKTAKVSVNQTLIDNSDPSPPDGRFENGSIKIGHGMGVIQTDWLVGNTTNAFWAPVYGSQPGFVIPFRVESTSLITLGKILEWDGVSTFLVEPVGLLNGTFIGGQFTIAGVNMTIQRIMGGGEPGLMRVQVAVMGDIPFTAHDDDDDTLLDAARIPNLGSLDGALAEAYVVPAYNTPGISNQNDLRPFQVNLTHKLQKDNADAGWGSRSLRANDLWIAYIVVAYQPDPYLHGFLNGEEFCDCDLDPNNEGGFMGRAAADSLSGPSGVATFVETIREQQIYTSWYSSDQIDGIVTVHEFGHFLAKYGPHPITTCDELPNQSAPCVPQYNNYVVARIRAIRKP